jgi:hypothetical protein
MANFLLRLLLRDAHGLSTTKNVNIEVDELSYITPETQYGAALAATVNFTQALDDIIDCVIEKVVLNALAAVTGLKTVAGDQGAAEGANLQLATLDNDGDPQIRPYWLPGAKAAVFNANFRTIDTGDADLLTWLSHFDEFDVKITISDGETVTGIDSGVYATRRRTV